MKINGKTTGQRNTGMGLYDIMCALAGIVALFPVGCNYIMSSGRVAEWMSRVTELAAGFQGGGFYLFPSADALALAGSSVKGMDSNVWFLLPGIIYHLSGNMVLAYRIFMLALQGGTLAAAMVLFQRIFAGSDTKLPAFFGVILYMTCPYRIYLCYDLGDLSQGVAWMLLPWYLWAVTGLLEGNGKQWVNVLVAALALAGTGYADVVYFLSAVGMTVLIITAIVVMRVLQTTQKKTASEEGPVQAAQKETTSEEGPVQAAQKKTASEEGSVQTAQKKTASKEGSMQAAQKKTASEEGPVQAAQAGKPASQKRTILWALVSMAAGCVLFWPGLWRLIQYLFLGGFEAFHMPLKSIMPEGYRFGQFFSSYAFRDGHPGMGMGMFICILAGIWLGFMERRRALGKCRVFMMMAVFFALFSLSCFPWDLLQRLGEWALKLVSLIDTPAVLWGMANICLCVPGAWAMKGIRNYGNRTAAFAVPLIVVAACLGLCVYQCNTLMYTRPPVGMLPAF